MCIEDFSIKHKLSEEYTCGCAGEGRMLVMKRRMVSAVTLTLLLTSMLTLAFNIQPVSASGSIYIRADGSIDPPTANITTSDNVTYTFTGNIIDSIVVERSNIIIDGNRRTLQGSWSGTGISLLGMENVTIKNANIKNYGYGIYLVSSSNNSISGNNITANNWYGIYLYSSSNNSISGNNITNNMDGIYLYSSSNNRFYHNNLIDNTQQVYFGTTGYANVWDDGYPSGGNYWSDYVGVDVKSGPNQDLPGSDSIGDTPYIIDANNTDHYPLMNPYGAPPLPTYTLTITTTVGGTTDPSPGIYSYTVNSTIQVTAIPEANYLFDYWELDSLNVGSANPYTVLMNKNHTLKAIFSHIKPSVPVGGYSIQIQVQTKAEPVLPYMALIAILATIFTKLRSKIKKQ
jgi:parallel beta-helix repeat protein